MVVLSILSIFILAMGFLINPSRNSPTIPSFPQFVYFEHIIGSFAVAMILFSILFFILKHSLLKKEAFLFSAGFSIGSTSTLSICYEVVRKIFSLIDWSQILADLIGIAAFSLLIWAIWDSR